MKTLSESLNFATETNENSHDIKVTQTASIDAYDTLCLICAELEIDTGKYTNEDFDSAAIILENAYVAAANSLHKSHAHSVNMSVWIDSE